MNGNEKILPEHRERRAFIYARQSTGVQVIKHHTSTERQLDLTQLAVGLGWSQSHVELVSEDLGRSGRLSENRSGFQRLAAEMSLGQVGAVLSMDASRLARSSADWHRLLEVAALTRTLLIDEQTVYDPRDPNDRLLLGMKGTMADFELVWLRQRMDGGRWHLARKGEYRKPWPAGYVYDGNRLAIDPSEEVQRAVRLLFERFRVGGSCRDVVEYFDQHGLRFPSRRDGHVVWNQLVRCRVREVLRNPTYAGAYVYGREHTEIVLRDGQRRKHVDWRPMEAWPVLIEKAHEGYISWEEFLANRKHLMDIARPSSSARGAPRDGAALLQGMLVCGPGYRGWFGRVGACSLRNLCYRRFCRCDSVKAKWRLKRLCSADPLLGAVDPRLVVLGTGGATPGVLATVTVGNVVQHEHRQRVRAPVAANIDRQVVVDAPVPIAKPGSRRL